MEKLVGLPYSWWLDGMDLRKDGAPSYAVNGPITIAYIKAQGSINCVGVINVMRRRLGLTIPTTGDPDFIYQGGTWIWFKTLKEKGLLQKFDLSKTYPKGSLLIRNYKNVIDQGHVAVVYRRNLKNVLKSKIMHSYPENATLTDKLVPAGLVIEDLEKSYYWLRSGFYTHVCLPEHWLTKEL
jgi:hypothetical protein